MVGSCNNWGGIGGRVLLDAAAPGGRVVGTGSRSTLRSITGGAGAGGTKLLSPCGIGIVDGGKTSLRIGAGPVGGPGSVNGDGGASPVVFSVVLTTGSCDGGVSAESTTVGKPLRMSSR